jgi:dTDP-4-amino-4,6-dideoxygalactose transaminase
MKQTLDDLALFGGAALFSEKLHVGRPNIGKVERLREVFEDILQRKWFTNGGYYVQEFQHRIEATLGVKHCIPMCNATVALEIAIRACGMRGEVIVPSMTFIATAHALQWQEITPVFCDIDPQTYNIDPQQIESLITPRTTGIIAVHLFGRPCNIEAVIQIAKRNGLKLLFDSAHAFGCSYRGDLIGRFGDAEVFSFHATKFMNSFEGGAVVTNDDELATKVRLMKNFGFTGYDCVDYIGTNGKMTEICAAMGIVSLESCEEFIAANRRNYHSYAEGLQGIQGLKLMPYSEAERCNYQYIILEVDPEAYGVRRDELIRVLHAENVVARRYFYPGCHQMEPYRSYFPHAKLLLSNTEKLCERILALPTGTAVNEGDIERICRLLKFLAMHSSGFSERNQAAVV